MNALQLHREAGARTQRSHRILWSAFVIAVVALGVAVLPQFVIPEPNSPNEGVARWVWSTVSGAKTDAAAAYERAYAARKASLHIWQIGGMVLAIAAIILGAVSKYCGAKWEHVGAVFLLAGIALFWQVLVVVLVAAGLAAAAVGFLSDPTT